MLSIQSALVHSLLFALVRLASGQAISSLPQCGQTCISNVIAEGASLGCPQDNLSCLCGVPDFGYGIRDCATAACGADIASTVTSAASALCATATLPANTATSTGIPTSVPAATSDVPAASAPGVSTSSAAVAQSSPLSSSNPAAATPSSSVTSGASEPSASQSSGSPNAASSTSGSSGSAAGTSSPVVVSPSTTSNGSLSTGAKAGIGIGAAAGAAMLIAAAVFVIARPRHKKTLPISEPLPGSGPSYANDAYYAQYSAPPRHASPGQMAELETRSRRYEDMVPRQSPRHIV